MPIYTQRELGREKFMMRQHLMLSCLWKQNSNPMWKAFASRVQLRLHESCLRNSKQILWCTLQHLRAPAESNRIKSRSNRKNFLIAFSRDRRNIKHIKVGSLVGGAHWNMISGKVEAARKFFSRVNRLQCFICADGSLNIPALTQRRWKHFRGKDFRQHAIYFARLTNWLSMNVLQSISLVAKSVSDSLIQLFLFSF